jgi:hypothetical protein
MSEGFDAFWAAYPRRRGANPRAPARTSWDRALKRGATPEAILAGARAYAADPSTKVGTEFVPMAVTWLNQRRWEDYQAPAQQTTPAGVWVAMDTPQWQAWVQYLGKSPPIDRNFGWRFPSGLPPQHNMAQVPSEEITPDPDRNPETQFFLAPEHI